MQAQTAKSPYTAPEAQRNGIRPFAPASARRRPVTTWKDSAQAALGAQVKSQTALIIVEVSDEAAPARNRATPKTWEWWQVIAPVIITLCSIAQLTLGIR